LLLIVDGVELDALFHQIGTMTQRVGDQILRGLDRFVPPEAPW
jgi:hypothetical protein